MSVSDPKLSARLSEAVCYEAGLEPDLYFVCEDGRKVPAHRSVVVVQSSLLESVLLDYPGYLTASVQIPGARYPTLCSLVSLLYTGQCIPGDDIHNINSLARQLLQIDLNIMEESTEHDDDNDTLEDLDYQDPLSEATPEQSENCLSEIEENVKPGLKSFRRRLEPSVSTQSPKSKEEKVLSCEICQRAGVSFPTMVEFQEHLAVEHFCSELTTSYGGKYKNCTLCGSKFVTVEKLARHLGIQHNKVLELYPKKVSSLTERIVKKYGVNDVQCSFCQIKFKNKQLLGTHIGAVHKKLEEFILDDDREIQLN